MPLTATSEGGQVFDPIKEGIHKAICTGVFDFGLQFNERFNTKKHEVLIQWELPEQRIVIENKETGLEEDKPRATSKRYTLSLHEKAILRKDLETWRGRAFTPKELEGFDILAVLGINCQIQIIHNTKGDKTYANVSAILPHSPGTESLKPENPLRSFSFEDDKEIPEGTPDWIREIIDAAITPEVTQEPPPIENHLDTIPF
jgi:hypothetical protein